MTSRISVIGLGYIGLPTAAMFASRRIEVIGVDVDAHTVQTINRGCVHIVEPDLDMVVQAAVSQGYLRATTTPEQAEAFLIATPTPLRAAPGDTSSLYPDLSYVKAATLSIAPVLRPGNLVILESTCPVGTTARIERWLSEARPDLKFPGVHGAASDIRIAHCPERVLPGRVMIELITNTRVIGGVTPACAEAAARLYRTFVTGDCVIASSPRAAELAKLTENSFRDVNIAFANELSLIAAEMDIDIWELIALANRHPRVDILQPGAGVGGHCIAVDPWFIVDSAPDRARLIRTARQVNDSKPGWVLDRGKAAITDFLARHPDRSLGDVRLACLGLAFKPDIDDLRESPAVRIAEGFADLGCALLAVEPHISALPASLTQDHVTLVDLDQALGQADVLCVLVKHSDFAGLPARLRPDQILVDVVGL